MYIPFYNCVDEFGVPYFSSYEAKMSHDRKKMYDQGYMGAEFTPDDDFVRIYGATTVRMWYNMGVTAAEFDASGEIPF